MKKIAALFSLIILWAGSNPLSAQVKGKDTALETLGMLSGMALYNTYMTIGGIADAETEEIYSKDEVIGFMDEQVSMIEGLETQFSDLLASGFVTDPSDIEFIKEIKVCLGYLKEEAKGLQDNMRTGDIDRYSENREKAWDKIAELLGIEGDE